MCEFSRDDYVAPIPEAERHDMVLAYHAQLNSADEETRLRAARAWTKWELSTSKLYVDPAHVAQAEKDDFAKCVFLFVPSPRCCPSPATLPRGQAPRRRGYGPSEALADVGVVRQRVREDREPLLCE